MLQNTKISIIIPIYNAEAHLNECLESILAQIFKEFELILINDGSLDRSGEICDGYALKDKRVSVYHLVNQGVSVARNFGIEKAVGQWIVFVDADDKIHEAFLSDAYNVVMTNEIDTLICGCCKIQQDQLLPFFNFQRGKYETDYFLETFYHHFACWGYFFSSSIIKDNDIRFHTQLSMSEDLLFVFNYLLYSKVVFTLDEAYYYYRVHDESVCRSSPTEKKVMDQLKAGMELSQIYCSGESVVKKKIQGKLIRILIINYLKKCMEFPGYPEKKDIFRARYVNVYDEIPHDIFPEVFSFGLKLAYSNFYLYIYLLKINLQIKNLIKRLIK